MNPPNRPEPPPGPAPTPKAPRPVERLFPFVMRARILLVGRDTLARSRSRLQFVLITEDLSDNSRERILADFAPYPIVRRYSSADLETHFGIKGAKVIGFAKSQLAKSLYAELKAGRINTVLEAGKGAKGAKGATGDAGGRGLQPAPNRANPRPSRARPQAMPRRSPRPT